MEGKFASVNGQNTFYIDEGQGPAVLLLHGASLAIDAISTWRSLVKVLSRQFRVIAFDQIGFGRSDLTPQNSYLNRLQRVDHALAFLDTLGVNEAILAGHSEGAFMAARMAIVRPQLTKRLIVIASGGLSPRIGGARDADWARESRLAYTYGPEVETEKGFIEQSRQLTMKRNSELEALLIENYRHPNFKHQLEMFRSIKRSENYPDDYIALQEEYIYPHVASLPPSLLIWGSNDQTVPVERAVLLTRKLPDADLHVFSGARHMVMYDRERAFNDLVLDWCSTDIGTIR